MESRILTCTACGRRNKVPPLAEGKAARCGVCGGELAAAAGHTGKPVVLSDATFREEIAKAPSIVVDFWAAWCGPCRTIAPVIEDLASTRSDVLFAKLDIDANPATASAFRVSSIPTLIFFKDGVEKGRVLGAVGRPAIEQAIRQHLGDAGSR